MHLGRALQEAAEEPAGRWRLQEFVLWCMYGGVLVGMVGVGGWGEVGGGADKALPWLEEVMGLSAYWLARQGDAMVVARDGKQTWEPAAAGTAVWATASRVSKGVSPGCTGSTHSPSK